MSNQPVIPLTDEQLQHLVQGLSDRWLSLAYCQFANPVRVTPEKVVFEEFMMWRDEFFIRLLRVLKAKKQNKFYALATESNDGKTITFTNGVSISSELPIKQLQEIAEDIGFSINGLEFQLCDDTLSWTIGSTVDIQFLTGDTEFFNAYFNNSEEEKAAINNFLSFISQDEILPEFRQMAGYLKPATV